MRNASTVLSFEDARLRAGRNDQVGSNRSYSNASPSSSDKGLDRNALSYVFDVDFGSASHDAFASYDDLSNPELGIDAEDIALAEEDIAVVSKKGLFAKLGDAVDKRKRSRNKARAEKAFNRSIGASSSNASDSAGPRAALYKAEMGSKQRRATRMQDGGRTWGANFGLSLPSFSLPDIPKKIMASLCCVLCMALLSGMLYTPAQQYYQQMRERDRLNAEYAAIVDRNESLQALVDNLESDEGIEDKAHSEFGLVKKGEQAGAATGFVVDDPSDFKANIAPGSVPAPETWYSGFLDFFFGYSS